MGCIYSCTCYGVCTTCESYKKENYIGHAEDLYYETYGYDQKNQEIFDYESKLQDQHLQDQIDRYYQELEQDEYNNNCHELII